MTHLTRACAQSKTERIARRLGAVLFDFDGTLTKPGSLDFAAIRRAIGCPNTTPVLEFIENLRSASAARRCLRILDRFETEAALRSVPNRGAEQLVLFLASLGLPQGIISRNSLKSIRIALRRFTRLKPANFAVILAREHVRRQKPHPEGVLLAARRMNVPVHALLVVGDYRFDIEAGRNAGAMTAFLDHGRAGHRPDPPADFTIKNLSELKQIARRLTTNKCVGRTIRGKTISGGDKAD